MLKKLAKTKTKKILITKISVVHVLQTHINTNVHQSSSNVTLAAHLTKVLFNGSFTFEWSGQVSL